MSLEDELQDKINLAKLGREHWIKLKEQYKITDKTYVILVPDIGTMVNQYVIKYLPQFAKKVQAEGFLFITADKELEESIGQQGIGCNYEVINWNDEKIEALLAYYRLQMFTDKLVIASLDKPEGRNGRNLIGMKGVTEEEAVAVGILGLELR